MIPIYRLRKSKNGFTLIELIVVIAILSILAAILVPAMISYLTKARAQQEEADLRSAYSAACAAFSELAVDGLYTKDKILEASKNHIGNNVPDGFDVDYTFDGIKSVSMTCSAGTAQKLTYDGKTFKVGASDHKH